MLEEGISRDEVIKMYPEKFQALGYDVAFDTDSMGRPKVLSSFEVGVNIILTLLFMKPGQYPSIPDLGIDIESYLHEYADDERIPAEIKNKLSDQCNKLDISGLTIDVSFDKTSEGIDALVIDITGNQYIAYGNETDHVIIGISYDKLNRLYVRRVNI
jgi:hypothetical protein